MWQTATDSYRGDYDVEFAFRGTPNTAEGGRQEPPAERATGGGKEKRNFGPGGDIEEEGKGHSTQTDEHL